MSVFLADQTIQGYRILRLLGKGGMAEVYEVEAEKTGALYALKVFVCEQANAIFLKKRFWSEARILSKLHHPRIVRVYDFGYVDTEEKTPYYVMDLVLDETGVPCSLRDALERGLSTEERIAAWYVDLVEALAYIHGKGVVHRDVSLENALVGPDGRVVLSDFGVCKIMDRDLRAEMNQTLVTMMSEGRPLMGKAFYIAPEVRAGKSETPASDLYSLGVLVFYLLNQVWYTPGAKIEDLLALFDEQWQVILPSLLNMDPDQRRCPEWKSPASEAVLSPEVQSQASSLVPARRRAWLMPGVLTAVAGLLVGGLLGVLWSLPKVREQKVSANSVSWEKTTEKLERKANLYCEPPQLDGRLSRASVVRVRPFVNLMVAKALNEEQQRFGKRAADQMFEWAADLYEPLEASNKVAAVGATLTANQALRLLCLQAAFRLYLQDRTIDSSNRVEQAVRVLKDIGEVNLRWQQDLLRSVKSLPDAEADTVGLFQSVWAKSLQRKN